LQQLIFKISLEFPADDRHSLTDQTRRSSRSIGAQIAEAWAKRDYVRHFRSKLSDADGEQLETRHWLTTGVDCGYLHQESAEQAFRICLSIGKMPGRMKEKADQFCTTRSNRLRDPIVRFFA
jgi:four helix bundle protein